MAQDDRFGSLKQESNPFREQTRRNRSRVFNDERNRRQSQRPQINNNQVRSKMTEAFGAYLEKQLGSQQAAPRSAYVPPTRSRFVHDSSSGFRSINRRKNQTTDFNDVTAFPELKEANNSLHPKIETNSGWEANGVDMISKPSQSHIEDTENDEIKPGWVRLSNGKITYGPPSSHYERMIYNMLQTRTAAMNELRKRHEQYRQYDYEMYGDRMLYEDRLGGFSEDEDDDDDSTAGDSGSSSYDSDNDGPYDDWY